MVYQANKRQFGALEGLAHWCAEYYYTLERFGADDAEMPAIRKDMSFCMDRCDALGVPYWAQNAALAWAEFLSTLSLRRATDTGGNDNGNAKENDQKGIQHPPVCECCSADNETSGQNRGAVRRNSFEPYQHDFRAVLREHGKSL